MGDFNWVQLRTGSNTSIGFDDEHGCCRYLRFEHFVLAIGD